MSPSEDAAKNTRSVRSHASSEIGFGNWNVVRREQEARSHIYITYLAMFTGDAPTVFKPTLTVWSTDAVRSLHLGNAPTLQAMSVIGSVWSPSVQYGVGRSFCRVSSTRLHRERRHQMLCRHLVKRAHLETSQTLTPESSLPESNASPS